MQTNRTGAGTPSWSATSGWVRLLAASILVLQAAATITITSREVELDERRTRSDVTDATDAGQRALEAPRLAGPSATVAPLQVPTPVAPTATSIATTTTTVAAPPPRPQAPP